MTIHDESIQITVEIPAAIASADIADRARLLLLLDAVKLGQIGWRTAARQLGMSLAAFYDLARDMGIPISRYELEDWNAERDTVERLALASRR